MSQTKASASKRRYFFWKYDQYPYLLGGPGVRLPNGRVETENYGRGFLFKPCYEFSLKDGRRFHDALKQLEAEHNKAISDVEDLYKRRLCELRNEAWAIEGVVVST